MAERGPVKSLVIGSNPITIAKDKVAEWLKAADCKPAFYEFKSHPCLNDENIFKPV